MKIGTYFAYWAQEWNVNFFPFVQRAAACGFDVLELSGAGLAELSAEEAIALRTEAKRYGITLTACIGLPKEYDVSSDNEHIRRRGIAYMKKIMDQMEMVDIHLIGGIIYSYWPVDYSMPIFKEHTQQISIQSVQELADYAKTKDITLALETVNRFEQFLFNDAAEATLFVKEVNRNNVKVMLDSFHMNIEEDSFHDAIISTGKYLGHFHIGETNRKVPGKGKTPWREIIQALKEINYSGNIVMEPFVRMGGTVGHDIKIWRDLSSHADDSKLDVDISEGCSFIKQLLND